ncbi:ATP-binding cassette domain-containing protein [Viridibacillus sp. YIM B01967]|uniref:ATP-binding cassette domain-containing protein n=1 Tax=Viridibacillus soli TaxID=2798301 RepID=A0ABS1H2Z4_9BACL|nr:ATP-binding cassette domain-containing protein [Viridibacillus soli]MBK3493768.1 ATP-binding cassette domain-containing protein [Viridibacillus soli]
MNPKIRFMNVSKSFSLYRKQSEKLFDIISLKKDRDQFFALRNISFEVNEGEAIGLIGLNGSGKSTLSNLLAQVIPPSSGMIEIKGETSLIAISVGLNNSLTGLENIKLKCLMHGLNNAEIDQIKSDIIEFADIGNFINQPVKNYSSGMKSRLGFAISIHTNPDILIVDEALSVGDQTFYKKCLDKINVFKSQGKTIIFVSHSLSQIEAFCERVMWIHFGQIKMFDEAKKVISDYKKFINWFNLLSEKEKKNSRKEMLDEQYKVELIPSNSHIQQIKRKSKKSNVAFGIQILVLLFVVILSASYMLL